MSLNSYLSQFKSYADFPIVTLSGTFEFVNVLDFKAIPSAISIIIAIYYCPDDMVELVLVEPEEIVYVPDANSKEKKQKQSRITDFISQKQ